MNIHLEILFNQENFYKFFVVVHLGYIMKSIFAYGPFQAETQNSFRRHLDFRFKFNVYKADH